MSPTIDETSYKVQSKLLTVQIRLPYIERQAQKVAWRGS
jgi:hypothetical protein